jgi:micrococcal nuclease
MDMTLQSKEGLTKDDLELSLFTYVARCFRVVDGDTLDLNIDLGMGVHNYQRVRLYGIDTPETYGVKKDSEEWQAGQKATARVKELVWDGTNSTPRDLWIETHKDKTGKYGRYLATIWLEMGDDLVCLNTTLVAEGLAVEATY